MLLNLKKAEIDTDATKLKKGGDRYGEFKSMKMKRPDGVTVSADMSTATKDKLPELTVTAKLGDLNKDGKMSSWEQARQDAIDSNSPATKNGDDLVSLKKDNKYKDVKKGGVRERILIKRGFKEYTPESLDSSDSFKYIESKDDKWKKEYIKEK